jgi:hypothetical protein
VKNMIQLGQQCRDRVTGYEGIAVGKAVYLTGCTQFGIVAQAGKGKVPPAEWFDEGRLEVIGKGIVEADVTGPANGGPNRDAPQDI